MSTHDDGGPAFPVPGDDGMTLRDYFAGQALAGMLADPHCTTELKPVAESAYRFADAMLAARKGIK